MDTEHIDYDPNYLFGREKIKANVQNKRIKCVEDVFYNLESKDCNLDSISEVKGLFNRVARRDQRDYITVNKQFGGIKTSVSRKIGKNLTLFRKKLKEKKFDELDKIVKELNILQYKRFLRTFLNQSDEDKYLFIENFEFKDVKEKVHLNNKRKESGILIKQGSVLSNDELCETFKCSSQGGMRRSHKTNTLVLVSNHIKSIYDDKWNGDIFNYTGMGGAGDQSLNFMQNKTLNESEENGVEIHLFEVFEEKKYFYQGRVKLKHKPFQENQTDEKGETRKVWMFPLEIIDNKPARIEFEILKKLMLKKEKKTSKISYKAIKSMVENQPKSKPSKRITSSETYERDEKVVKYALFRANGVCELCDKPAPFVKKDGSPFLEVHHIEYLSNGGNDSIENVSAICPNCHRKMHALELKKDIEKLKEKAKIKLKAND